MKKSVLLLCALICAIAYAGNGDDKTKGRLSTGLKVNSAIDNPSSYYTAQSLKRQKTDSVKVSKQDIQKNMRTFNPFAKFLKK